MVPNKVSGIQLAQKLVEAGKCEQVLFASGHSQVLMEQKDKLLSGKHFPPKPFDVNRLLRRVSERLHSAPARFPHSPVETLN